MNNKNFFQNKIFHNIENSLSFLSEHQIILFTIECPRCKNAVHLKSYKKSESNTYIYRCSKKNCNFSKNLMSYSIFPKTRIELPTLLFIIFLAMNNTPNKTYKVLINENDTAYTNIKRALVNVYRQIIHNDEKIGGEGTVIEIDETVISRRGIVREPSNTDDDTPGTVWLLGMINRNNIREFRLFIIPNRKIDTLTSILRQNIKPNTHIITDGHPSYPQVVRNIGCLHTIVNHSLGFTNDIGESTNKIENLWSHLKADIRKENGVKFTNIRNYLSAFTFRKRFIIGRSNDEIYSLFLLILAKIFKYE